MLDSIYYRRMFGRSNRAPFSPIKMNDSVSRRDCGVPGNGSDVTHGRAAATPPRCRARASVCLSVARFVYWNRLFVFDPDGTLSTPVDFVPFTHDRFARSPFRKNAIFLFSLSSFFLFCFSSSIATTIRIVELESVRDRSSTEKFLRNRSDRGLSANEFLFLLIFSFLSFFFPPAPFND